jgi:hypothetical protein
MAKVEITGLEANYLLFALDFYLHTDTEGKINPWPTSLRFHGYTRDDLQALRDKLFDAHEHPKENGEL